MHALLTNYYFLKQIVDKLPKNIEFNKEISKDLIFNFANFNSTSYFYKKVNKKKDKYQLFNKIYDKSFDSFYVDLLIELKKDLNPYKLLFSYGIYTNYYLTNNLKEYILKTKNSTTTLDEAYNMLDFYFANKNDDINLKKTNLRLFFLNGYNYFDYMEELIHKPLLKNYNIFNSYNYFKKSYKNKEKFYSFCTKSRVGIRKILFKLFSRIYKINTKFYFYNDKIDTKLINLQRNKFEINDKTYELSLEEYINEIKKEVLKIISDINDYLFYNNDKKIRKLFNIPDEKNL